MNRKIHLLTSSIIVVLTIILFATGSPLLTISVLGIPFGNLLLWLGFVALHLFFYKLNHNYQTNTSKIGKSIKLLATFLLIISILWFIIAYVLSGNVGFNFSGAVSSYLGSPRASILFWNIIYVLTISPFILSLLYTIIRYIEYRKNR